MSKAAVQDFVIDEAEIECIVQKLAASDTFLDEGDPVLHDDGHHDGHYDYHTDIPEM